MPGVHDELKYVRDKELMQDLSKEPSPSATP